MHTCIACSGWERQGDQKDKVIPWLHSKFQGSLGSTRLHFKGGKQVNQQCGSLVCAPRVQTSPITSLTSCKYKPCPCYTRSIPGTLRCSSVPVRPGNTPSAGLFRQSSPGTRLWKVDPAEHSQVTCSTTPVRGASGVGIWLPVFCGSQTQIPESSKSCSWVRT